MLVYLGLLLLILILTLVCNEFIKDNKLKAKIITGISLLAIYLLYVLKDYSIGSDTDAYFTTYEQMKNVPFGDFETIYMEEGYQCLMQLCILAKMEFRGFLLVAYAISIIPLYFFITKFSKNASLSIIIYICYQFLVFSMSGIRQTIATGMCLTAYLMLESKIKWKHFWFLLLVLVGYTFHQSAIVFIFVPLIKQIPFTKGTLVLFLSVFAFIFIFRTQISTYLAKLTGYRGSFTLGLNYILVLFIVVFSILVFLLTSNTNEKKKPDDSYKWFKFSFYALMLHTALYTTVLLRAASLLTIFFLLLIPSLLEQFDNKSRKVLTTLINFALVIFFITTVLVPNQLEIAHYKFFWQ